MVSTKEPNESNDLALNKLKAIAGEHFDDYLMIVVKDGHIWNTYKTRCSAHGMAAMMISDIQQEWIKSKNE